MYKWFYGTMVPVLTKMMSSIRTSMIVTVSEFLQEELKSRFSPFIENIIDTAFVENDFYNLG